MNILAIDLGTQCGWALSTPDYIRSGSESLHPRSKESSAHRWLKFRRLLSETKQSVDEIHVVYYEIVHAHAKGAIQAAHIYGGFLAHLETWCELQHARLEAVGVGTIKRNWTGKGNADKATMIEGARIRGLRVKDDNEADALAILEYARQREGAGTQRLGGIAAVPALPIEAEHIGMVGRLETI